VILKHCRLRRSGQPDQLCSCFLLTLLLIFAVPAHQPGREAESESTSVRHFRPCCGIVKRKHVLVAAFDTGRAPTAGKYLEITVASSDHLMTHHPMTCRFSTMHRRSPQDVHREETVSSCRIGRLGCRVLRRVIYRVMKAAAEVCPACAGSGWKPVPGGTDRGVTRCDCRLRAREGALIAAARIPKRYEHCELSNFEFEGPQLHLAPARMAACRFVEEYPVNRTGLLLVGDAGLGKTHLAVGIAKALIREKGIECVFYDYADLLKQIQDSYNP
jgi:DNA replication protein DnaC